MVNMLEVIRGKFYEGLKLCPLYLLYDEPVIHCFCKESLAFPALSIPLLATAQGCNVRKLRWTAFLSKIVELVRVYTDY
jgi:hypothetical protein